MDIEKYKKTLPNIPGIQGKDEYFNSSVLVLIVNISGRDHFVFQKRSAKIRQGGEICFPGGKIDKNDKSPLETALRETKEELGLDKSMITVIGQMDTIFAPIGATVDAFLGYIDKFDINEIKENKEEVEEVIILPVDDFKNPKYYKVILEILPSKVDKDSGEEVVLLPAYELGLPEKYSKPWGGFQHKVIVYDTPKGVIWGITARLVHEIVNKID